MKNFHLPLADDTYRHLRSISETTKVPATSLAREAIDLWLADWTRRERHRAISNYASEMATTEFDLDPDLEAAGVEHLLHTNREVK
jgi:hypothetical protein